MTIKSWIIFIVIIAAAGAGGYVYWQQQLAAKLPDGIVSSNGRTEAIQINIATKFAGQILEVRANEGDMVEAGQVVAQMDTAGLQAQKRRAEADIRRSQKAMLEVSTTVLRSKSQLKFAESELKRVEALQKKGYATEEKRDLRRNELQAAYASYRASVASVEQSEEAIISAKEELERIKTQLDDAILKAPRRGRVQYRLAEPGEVLAAGGGVLTLLDLADVYMTVFLPASEAGVLEIGGDARIVLDPIPENTLPANVSFVAADAQFTPKAVETKDERAKLMFRVKLRFPPELLKKYEGRVKTGVRGIAYLRLPGAVDWPENLQIKLPE